MRYKLEDRIQKSEEKIILFFWILTPFSQLPLNMLTTYRYPRCRKKCEEQKVDYFDEVNEIEMVFN